MNPILAVRISLLVAGLLLTAIKLSQSRRRECPGDIGRVALLIVALINLVFVGFLWVNHIRFPLNLDLMEGTVLQHIVIEFPFLSLQF